ncbi:hypothetical protein V1289_005057 [Bradyrhizobium sp. AZCC 2289]
MLYPLAIGKARYPGAKAFGAGFRFTSPGKRISFEQPFGVSRRGSPRATIFLSKDRTGCGPILGKLRWSSES